MSGTEISFGSNQIVGGSREGEDPADKVAVAEPGLLLSGDCLQPNDFSMRFRMR